MDYLARIKNEESAHQALQELIANLVPQNHLSAEALFDLWIEVLHVLRESFQAPHLLLSPVNLEQIVGDSLPASEAGKASESLIEGKIIPHDNMQVVYPNDGLRRTFDQFLEVVLIWKKEYLNSNGTVVLEQVRRKVLEARGKSTDPEYLGALSPTGKSSRDTKSRKDATKFYGLRQFYKAQKGSSKHG